MWQLRQLEAFKHAMDEGGSLTRAAEKLHVTQPAISKLICTLEEKCGFPLFVRRGNRMTATAEGQMLYREVLDVFSRSHDLEHKVAEIRSRRSGTLRMTAFPALATRVLPKIVMEFCEGRPDVQVFMSGRSSIYMIEWLIAQRMDLGISVLPVEERGLSSTRLLSADAVCVLPRGHRLEKHRSLTPQQIAAEPFISLGAEDHAAFLINQFFEKANVRPKSIIQTQLSEAACQFVIEGAGIAIVDPFSALGFSPEQLTVKRLSKPVTFTLWLIAPTAHPQSLMATEFVGHFTTAIKRALSEKGFSCS